ncbi:hypothetical protein FLAN108750_06600 [Flavobacterium antarcticum]
MAFFFSPQIAEIFTNQDLKICENLLNLWLNIFTQISQINTN